MERYKKKFNEARRKVDYDFKNGIKLISYGMSPNGNHTVTIELPSGKKKSIQTNSPALNTVHSYLRGKFRDIDKKDLEKIGKELLDYSKNL